MRFLLLLLLAALPVSGASIAVRVPVSAETATNAVIISNGLVDALENFPTSSIRWDNTFLKNYISRFGTNTYTTNVVIFGGVGGINVGLTNGLITGATITNGFLSGTVTTLTGGIWTGGTFSGPVFTNAVNHGAPFASPGLGSESLQLGGSAEANADNSTAIGDASVVNGLGGTALGSQATVDATAPFGVALGFKSLASGGAGVAIGTFAEARNTNSMALGVNALAMHDNAIAFANDTTTTTNNQIRLGNSGHTLSVPGDGNFGQKLAVGSDNYLSWPDGLNRGVAFVNGSSPSAAATNSWVAYSEAAQAFYRTGSAGEGAEQNNRMHNRGATVTGTGTAYSFTGSTARVDFSGQDPEILLPTAGTYFITAVVEIVNGATANDEYHVKFRNFDDDLDITDSERAISNLPVATIGQLCLQNVITVNDSKTIVLWGHNATAARGTIAAARTSLSYVRLY